MAIWVLEEAEYTLTEYWAHWMLPKEKKGRAADVIGYSNEGWQSNNFWETILKQSRGIWDKTIVTHLGEPLFVMTLLPIFSFEKQYSIKLREMKDKL